MRARSWYPAIALLATVLHSSVAVAELVAELSLERCELGEVVARLQVEPIEKTAAIAKQQLQALNELSAINAKAKVSDKPIAEQLGAVDLERFSELRQQLIAMNLATLIESRRERDLRVLKILVQIADKNYRWQEEVKKEDPLYFLQGIVSLWRFMASDEKNKTGITTPESSNCSMEYAIHRIEREPIDKLGRIDMSNAVATLNKLAERYGKPIDRAKLSKPDRRTYDEVMNNVLKPAERARQYIDDLEYIKIMARASDIRYEANARDVAISGGRREALGTTIGERMNAKAYDDRTTLALGLWGMINEKVPPEIVKDWERMGEVLDGPAKPPAK